MGGLLGGSGGSSGMGGFGLSGGGSLGTGEGNNEDSPKGNKILHGYAGGNLQAMEVAVEVLVREAGD